IQRFQRNEEVSIFGIIGNPVSQSRSPHIQNRNFADASLPWIYLPFFTKDVRSLLEIAPTWRGAGFSITHPWKEKVIDLLDFASPEVQMLRSCNTVACVDGKWHGINTDVDGIRELFKDVSFAQKRVVIIGAGASSRAIAMVVRPLAASVTILNR